MAIPKFSNKFLGRPLTMEMNWKDLVLSANTHQQVIVLESWLNHHRQIMEEWGMHKRLTSGYRALFSGPSGTGKTLTAALIGKTFKLPVCKVDLSIVISKYIGETEKNLSRIFKKAAGENWILFFDEADALFGKRTVVKDEHDRYANLETAYLMQSLEHYPGMSIVSVEQVGNMDNAFVRRFQSVIEFPRPDAELRLQLWQNTLPKKLPLSDDIDLDSIAGQYELNGWQINNIVQHLCLLSTANDYANITQADIVNGIRRELAKV